MTTALFLVLTTSGAYAQSMAGSKHDLTDGADTFTTSVAANESNDELCVFCHTPHHADAQAPLWNRDLPTATGWTMYNSPTMDATVLGAPQGISLACLSCHDGTIAFDSLLNKPGSGLGTPGPAGWAWQANGGAATAPNMNITDQPAAYLSKDLSNDHPISIQYGGITEGTAAGQYNVFDAGTGKVNGTDIQLYGAAGAPDQVECASCHNPHNATIAPFLRVSNANSALCLTCHQK